MEKTVESLKAWAREHLRWLGQSAFRLRAGVSITGVAACNLTKRFHPRSGNWLGYVVEVEGVRLYHAGDTDPVPEMKDLRPDIALIPVGGMFAMNWREGARAVSLGAVLSRGLKRNARSRPAAPAARPSRSVPRRRCRKT